LTWRRSASHFMKTTRWHQALQWPGCHYTVGLLYPRPSASCSQTRAVGKATRLRIRQSCVRIPARAEDYSFLQTTQTSSGTHPISYSLHTGVLSHGPSGRVVTLTTHLHQRPVKMGGATPPRPLYAIMMWSRTVYLWITRVHLASKYSTHHDCTRQI